VTRQCPQAPRRAQRVFGVVLALSLFCAPASAQTPIVEYDGVEIFCHILKHFKFDALQSIDALAQHKPEETLIVVFGDLAPLDAIRKQVLNLNDYALLIASDRQSGERQNRRPWRWVEMKLTSWRLKIEGSEVHVSEPDAYQGKPRCPLLTPAEISRNHPIFRSINVGLATNGPSFLTSEKSDLHLLARFPRSAGAVGGPRLRDEERAGYIFGTSADSAQRILFLAGHGVFMNGMIAQSDNDNGLFAINTVRWLREAPDGGKRKHALMIHDGKVIESFGLPLTALPPVPIPPVRVINRMLRELENEGIPHRFLEEVVGWSNMLRYGLLAATLGLFLYGIWRLFPARHSQEAVPLVVGMQARSAPTRTVTQQRQLEQLSQDNLWEPAQALARQWFLDHAHVDTPLWDQAHDAGPPVGQYRAGWWARQKLAQQLGLVWDFAVRDPAERVSLREFRKLADAVQALDHAAQSGQLAFPRGKTPSGQ